jgi:hypothetical protein
MQSYPHLKTLLLSVSAALNLLFIALFVSALSGKTASIAFYDMDSPDKPAMTAAVLASVPRESGVIEFSPLKISLKKGDAAVLQYSVLTGGKQANWLLAALYDHDIVTLENSGYGIIIHALKNGETTLQMITEEGIRDLAAVSVLP